jgi:tetratricopeptide (TPR) repeat protein
VRAARWMVALLAVACLGCATRSQKAPWIEVRTQHLELFAALPESRASELAGELELLRSVVEVLTGSRIVDPPVPLRVFLVPDNIAYRSLGPRYTAGFFLPTMRNGNIVALTRPGYMNSALRVLQHEYVHWLVENRDAYPYPRWYNEGFAQFLSTVYREGDVVKIGRAPVARVKVFDSGAWLGLERLMSARSFAGWKGNEVSTFYAQSWALVHYLNFGQPAGRSLRQQMGRYLKLFREGVPADRAVSEGFGVGIEALEAELRAYVSAAQFTYVDAQASRFEFDGSTTTRVVPPAEIMAERGWLQLDLDEASRARRLFKKALDSDPGHARAHAGLGAVEASTRRWAEAEAHLTRAVELAPDTALNHLDLANLYHERAREASEPATRALHVGEARTHYRNALALDDTLPEAHARYGATWSLPGEDPERRGEGLVNLERANRLLPGSTKIKLLLARRYADVGRRDQARALAIDALAGSHGAEISTEAQTLIDELGPNERD